MSRVRKAIRLDIIEKRSTIQKCRKIFANATIIFEDSISKAEVELAEKEQMLVKLEK